MARSGIQFSDVKRAAEALVADGIYPSVSRVVEVVGGSNTTVGPYLKEWRKTSGRASPLSAEVGRADSGLDEALIDAVREIFKRLEISARIELEREREDHQKRVVELNGRVEDMTEKYSQALQSSKAITAEFERLRSTLAEVEAIANERQVKIGALEASAEATAQHLADRAAQIHQLRGQIEQARQQFEHFAAETHDRIEKQEAKHADKSTAYETALKNLQDAFDREKAQCIHLETSLGFERTAHGATKQELAGVRAAEQAAQASLALAKSTVSQMEERLTLKRQEHEKAREQVSTLEKETQSLRVELGSRESQVAQMREQLATAERRLDALYAQGVAAPAARSEGEAPIAPGADPR